MVGVAHLVDHDTAEYWLLQGEKIIKDFHKQVQAINENLKQFTEHYKVKFDHSGVQNFRKLFSIDLEEKQKQITSPLLSKKQTQSNSIPL